MTEHTERVRISREMAVAIARDAAKRIWLSVQSEADLATSVLEALGRHFHIAPPKPVISRELAEEFADLAAHFAPRDSVNAGEVHRAIRERFDVRD